MIRSGFGRGMGMKRVKTGGARLDWMALAGALLVLAANVPGAWAGCDCTDTATTGVPQIECEALVTLFNSTDGANWYINTNWDTDTELGNWYGVTVEGGRITGLNLEGNDLNGAIPPQLGNLSKLRDIFLNGNQLSGSIPKELGNLGNLQMLILYSSQLTGSIPKELGNLSKLQDLILADNQLTGSIPKELGNLGNLQFLHLQHNQLTGSIPKELGNLGNLQELYLDYCQLTGPIPNEIGSLNNLQYLYLPYNQLTGSIPKELGNLENLRHLCLNHNQLTGTIPAELGNMDNLRWLHLDSNQLTGSIPTELGSLSNLQYLWLFSNQLTGDIPPELENLSNLQILHLYSNQLTGDIPPELINLGKIKVINLGENQLAGNIPPELGSIDNLESLNLASNQLTGSIPAELGNLNNLTSLYLSSNQLTGTIPPELGSLGKLNDLHLDYNQLYGGIPVELGSLSNLRELHLGSNQLAGGIPMELGSLSNLRKLYLGQNQLAGEIPLSLTNLTKLGYQSVDIGHNMLTASGTVAAFFDAEDPNWADTQTIPPTDLGSGVTTPTTAEITWTPIPYAADGGFYRVKYATNPGGPYSEAGTTDNKTSDNFTVAGLSPNTSYHFVVETFTPSADYQQSDLTSPLSMEISATTAGVPEIAITGGGNPIADGDTATATTNGTDFGPVLVASGTAAQTFTITNAGSEILNINSAPPVEITGTHFDEFTVTATPAATVAGGGGTTTFEITFDPAGPGTRTATVTIPNDDADEAPFDFAVAGTGISAVAPTVSTDSANNVTDSDAKINATVSSDGGAVVTDRGVCWSLASNPTTGDNVVQSGSGTGAFVVTLSGLQPNTTYYVRAYAINVVGTAYGNEMSFATSAVLPQVSTDAISNILSSSATIDGTVLSDGGASVTERGFCFGENPEPTLSDAAVAAGSGVGAFSASLTGLNPGTLYYVRAYATNTAGTTYGNEITFSTNAELPQVSTGAISNVFSDSAQANGTVTSDGGAAVTERGFCWSTSPNPTISDFSQLAGSGTGAFSASLDGLAAETLYYVRAFAKNSAGISYGNDLTFTTSEEPIQPGDADGNGEIELTDAILILQILTGDTAAAANATLEADVNNDGHLGLEDAVYILRVVSQTP